MHNGRETIAHAIHSALGQTHSNVEVIVVDDASTDSTWEELSAQRDSRLRLIRHPRNLGEGASRNTAVAAATGAWIAMLDADDTWDGRRLEKLLSLDRDGGEGVVLADNVLHCYGTGGNLKPWRRQWDGSDIRFTDGIALLNTTDYLGLKVLLLKPLIRRRLLLETGIVHSNRVFGADTEFLIRVLKSGCRLLITDEPLYFYRKAPGSMSDNPRRATLMREMFEELLRELPFSAAEAGAIRRRIGQLRLEERYMPFLRDLRSRQWLPAAVRVCRDPWLLGEFLRRLPESLRYRMHVALHGGKAT